MFNDFRNAASAFGKTKVGRPFKSALHETVGRKAGIFGNLFAAYEVYQGYKKGGVTGAIKGLGVSYGWALGMQYVKALGMSGAVTTLAIGAAAGIGAYKYMQGSRQYGKRMKSLEMSTPFVDEFGTAATMRQRSVQALQRTHLNSRSLLGSEGALLHNIRSY